jgi:FlaA1/EpsC-like NDP-sugar epimerase
MGEPVRIVDLARLMIRLSGHDEDRIRIEYSGLRPGEKLYEELLADSESTLPTPHPKLFIARARPGDAAHVRACLDWLATGAQADDAEVRSRLRRWIPEYQPSAELSNPELARP